MLARKVIGRGRFVFLAGVLLAPWLAFAHPQTPQSGPEAVPSVDVGQTKGAPTDGAQANTAQTGTSVLPLIVAKDTPLRVVLEQKVRVRHVNQPVKGRVVEDVYRFDRVVIPKGSEVLGRISRITHATPGRRVRSYLNADFSPPSKVEVQFDFLVLPDGTEMPIDTAVSPGIPDAVRLMSPNRKKSRAREAVEQAKSEAKQKIHETIEQVRAPGKMERLKDYLVAQLPYRPQSLRKGTLYEAALVEPLDFGSESVKLDSLEPPGTRPPANSEVKARLLTPLDSAITQKNAPVEAMITQPVYSAEHKLILPEGSLITGRVTRAQPARRWHRNGQLNLVLTDVVWPSGEARRVEASLDSVEASRSANLALDSEGGAAVKESKTRYLKTGLSIAVAAAAASDVKFGDGADADADRGAVAGEFGLRLVGMVVGYAARSQAFSTAMGIYGASTSVYQHFLSRGRNVVFQKDMPMEVSFAEPAPEKPSPAPEKKD